MTNKEAIKKLKEQQAEFNENYVDFAGVNTAYDLAIKALERDGWLDYDECGTSCLSCPVCGAVWRKKEK